jgi:hypothetical protein
LISRFLLVKLQADHVLSPKNKAPLKIKADLENLPTSMEDLYLDVMKRIDDNGDQELAKILLSWLFYTPEPMGMAELQVAAAVLEGDCQIEAEDLRDPESLIEHCQSLIIYDHATCSETMVSCVI